MLFLLYVEAGATAELCYLRDVLNIESAFIGINGLDKICETPLSKSTASEMITKVNLTSLKQPSIKTGHHSLL